MRAIDAATLEILHEDAHLLVVNKPAGVSTQAPPIAGPTLETAVRAYLKPEDPGSAYIGLVHRLDRPVSGVVLFAKTSRDARRVSGQFAARRVQKEYWAVVEGTPVGPSAVWEDWLWHEGPGGGAVQVVAAGAPEAREARTRMQFVATAGGRVRLPEGCSWLRLDPETGRTHQLRVQSARRGLPILGDALYGAAGRAGSDPSAPAIALHARRLTVQHPALNRPLTLVAPTPAAWADWGIGPLADPA